MISSTLYLFEKENKHAAGSIVLRKRPTSLPGQMLMRSNSIISNPFWKNITPMPEKMAKAVITRDSLLTKTTRRS